jgi:hypothetical protein
MKPAGTVVFSYETFTFSQVSTRICHLLKSRHPIQLSHSWHPRTPTQTPMESSYFYTYDAPSLQYSGIPSDHPSQIINQEISRPPNSDFRFQRGQRAYFVPEEYSNTWPTYNHAICAGFSYIYITSPVKPLFHLRCTIEHA